MVKRIGFPRLFLGALVAAGLLVPALSSALASPRSGSASVRVLTGTLKDGAAYKLEVPKHWNGTLFLYSHGYVPAGSANPARDVGDPLTGLWLLRHGYALAGSSYATTGWALAQALPDQITTLNKFVVLVGHPARTIAWGHSLGGIITAGLIQRYPQRFAGALPMCGVVSGAVATWNTALDAAFAFKALISPSVVITHITDPLGNLVTALSAAAIAQQTPQGRARLALVSALADIPGWYAPLSPEPGHKAYAAQELNQFQWGINVDFPFAFAARAELEGRAGGNPSWNTGVDYTKDLARSADAAEVLALYHAAGLSLSHDLRTLNHTPRIAARPSALAYLKRNIVFDGKLAMPVLTMHTTGDGLVVPENEQAYAKLVAAAGKSALLRQIFVHRAGHCAFTPAETITAAKDLLRRLNTGHWPAHVTDAHSLNASAAALGHVYNVFGSPAVATPPAFVKFRVPAYLRPFDARSAH